jgi:hypothetical protein
MHEQTYNHSDEYYFTDFYIWHKILDLFLLGLRGRTGFP